MKLVNIYFVCYSFFMRKHLRNYFIPHEGNDYKPHSVRSLSLLAFLVVAGIIALATLVSTNNVIRDDNFAAVHEAQLTELTSAERVERGLSPLREDAQLVAAARLKARDMINNQYFAHTSPRGVEPWDWFRQVGYNYQHAGENLAIDFYDTRKVNQAWLDSPTHRANILSDRYTDIGIAVEVGEYQGREVAFVVQMFGTRRTPAVVTTPEPIEAPLELEIENESQEEAQVLGETVDQEPETSDEPVVVKSEQEPVPENQLAATLPDPEGPPPSSETETEVDKIPLTHATQAGSIGKILMLVLASIVALALLLKTFIEMKRQHYGRMIATFIVLLIIIALYVTLALYTGQVTIV